MNRKLLLIPAALLFAFTASSAFAQSSLTCVPGSGVWRNIVQDTVLEGVLCSADKEAGADFYRLDFNHKTGQFAPAIPNGTGTLRYLFASPKVLFYADDAEVYALEREHFRVIWHRPWKAAQRLPLDDTDLSHQAILSQTDEGYEIHLVKSGAQIEEEMSAALGKDAPIQVIWQSRRLVVIERSRLIFWPRPGVPIAAEPGSPAAESVIPQSWKTSPTIVNISPELADGDYELDPDGLMVLNRTAKKLSYYRFNTNTWTTARINATAAIQGLGSGSKYAMAVTIDANTVRVVARLGSFLQNRFEAKYWKLSTPPETIVVGQDDIAALDGGSDNRVQTIDTTEMTWKRLALIEYPTPGRIAELQNDELMTIHNSGSDALMIWNARTGQKLVSLPAQKLTQIDFGSISSARTIPGFKRYKLLVSLTEQFVIFDTKTGSLSAPLPFEKVPWSDLPRAIELTEQGMVVHVAGSAPTQWDIYPADDSDIIHKSLADFQNARFDELLTPQEKWYGYCLADDDCFQTDMPSPEQMRKTPAVAVAEAPPSHAPTAISWILCILAFIAMFAVMFWRRGFGRKSMLKGSGEDAQDLADIFDAQNRRYISDRDNRYFLAPHLYSTPVFRACLSVILGLGVGILVAAPFFFDDTGLTFLSWIVILGTPVAAVTWVATSWTYWNRYYLLRFGNLVEGKWENCAKTNPSIIYEPVPGKVFELDRHQWTRIDFVPMVLFDPARPNFAIQYTGGCSHSVIQSGTFEEKPSRACTFDVFQLCPVIGFLAVTIISTQMLFNHAYPNPLSAWKLDSLANYVARQDSEEELTFTTACLDVCSDDPLCHKQCHQRQLRLVLQSAGLSLAFDPTITTAEFLDLYRADVEKARSILLEQPTLGCNERNEQIEAITLWPDNISKAFWSTYANPQTFGAAHLGEIYQNLKRDAATLKALCDEDGACARNSQACPVPPTCPGSVSLLKARVCAFQKAMNIPEIKVPE